MLPIVFGPALFLSGAVLLALAVHGLPTRLRPFARPQEPGPAALIGGHFAALALPRLARGPLKRTPAPVGGSTPQSEPKQSRRARAHGEALNLSSEDTLLADLLCQMMKIREEMAALQLQLASLKESLPG